MAALSKRDIEMIFRAETDAAQRPVNALSSDVKKLRGTLDELAKSTGKTDKSLEDLAATTRDLEKAQNELGTARSLLTQLNAQQTALERSEAAAEAAAKKYAELKAQVDGAEKPLKRLTTSLDAAERKMAATNQRLTEQRESYKEVKASIESIIGPVDNLQNAFRTVAVAQRDISAGLAQAKSNVSEFKTEIAGAAAEAAKLQATEAFKGEAAAAGLSSPQIAAIAEETNRTQLLAKAKAELAAQDRQLQAIATAQAETQNVQFVEALKNEQLASQAAVEAAQRLKQVDAFRTVASDAIAAQSATERLAANIEAGVTPAQKLAQSVLGLVNPAAVASTTLDGMDTRLEAVLQKLSGGKVNATEFNNLNNELVSLQANLLKVSTAVDAFVAQEAKVTSAAGAYDLQAAKVRDLAAAEITAETNLVELTSAMQKEEAVLASLGSALDAESAKLKALGAGLKGVGVDSSNIPGAIAKIESTATRAAPAIAKVANAVSPNGKKGFLGLDPFALQNLSYQVNDVFTSLASGISPMQTLAQQGGQIVQIPGLLSKIVQFFPLIAIGAGAIGLFVAALGEANTQLETMRTASTVLASLGDTNGFDAKKFQDVAQSFRDIGVSAEDALKATKVFVSEGLNPKAVDDYVIAAKNMATVTGTDVPTAAAELTKAFTGGVEQVIALDDKMHFLTDTQRENLIASKDTKNEYNEVNKAFSALYTKMQNGANAAKGPMTDATNTLRNAWNNLLKAFGETGVLEQVQKYLASAVIGFTYLINVARRAAKIFAGAFDAYQKYSIAGPVVGMLAAGAKIGSNIGEGAGSNIFSGAADDSRAQYAESQKPLQQAQQAPGADAGQGSRGRQKDREGNEKTARAKAARDAKKAASEAEAARKRAEREAIEFQKQYVSESQQLENSLSTVTAEALKNGQGGLAAQLDMAKQAVDAQFNALEDRLNAFHAKFGDRPINGMSQEQYRSQLEAQKAAIQQSKILGVYESNVNDLLKQRSERLKSVQDDQKAGLIDSTEAMDQTYRILTDMAPKIDEAIGSARAFIAALAPSNETKALLDKFDRISKQGSPDSGGTIQRNQAKTGAVTNEQKINEVFQQRAALIEAANNLYEAGATNYTQKEAAIKSAYDTTNGALQTNIQSAREYLLANQDMFPPGFLDEALAKLDLYDTKLKYTSELHDTIKSSAEAAFTQGFTTFFDTLADNIGKVVAGSESLGDLFKNIGMAALQFAASFAKAIAQAIIQLYALRIAKSLIGGFHGGGVVGDLGRGRMVLSRNVGPDLSNVPRYHNGIQGVGLKSDEQMAILQKGENVQTKEQQAAEKRRLINARKGNDGQGLRQVLAFGDDQIAAAMAGPAGQDVTITHIRRNKTRIRKELGIG